MLKQCFFVLALISCGPPAALADTIQLKDKVAVVGKILSEKKDQLIVDLGFTVLAIPRNQILKISKSDAPEPAPKSSPAAKSAADTVAKAAAETRPGFYSAPNKPSPL